MFTVISQCREPAHSRPAIIISELKKSSMNIRWWQKCQFHLSPRVPSKLSLRQYKYPYQRAHLAPGKKLEMRVIKVRSRGDTEYQAWFLCNHSHFGKYLIIRIKATPFISDFIKVMSHRATAKAYWCKPAGAGQATGMAHLSTPMGNTCLLSSDCRLERAVLSRSSRPLYLRDWVLVLPVTHWL